MEELIEQYHQGEITKAQLAEGLQTHWDMMQADLQFADYRREEMFAQVMRQGRRVEEKAQIYWLRYAAAAVILFAVAGAYFLLQPKKPELLSQTQRFKK